MQKVDFKIILSSGLIVLLLLFGFNVKGQGMLDLDTADSLFQAKRYTQSLKIYEQILAEKNASPAMLLKMAYISEGMERPDDALFYLQLYYLQTSDKAVASRMTELAGDLRVSGYEDESSDFLASMYHRFENELIYILLALGLLSFSVSVYRKRKLNEKPYLAFVLTVLFFAGAFYLTNFDRSGNWGIIDDVNTPVMAGPGSGSDLVTIARAGHKIRILGDEDIWIKILWNGQVAYIKRSHIRSITG